MKILILNWRDPKHPLSGGAEISLFEHAKYWQKKKNEVIWFASSFASAKKVETLDGIKVIRVGSHFTVHLWAYIYFKQHKLGTPDLVIDSFHFLPFFTPLYMPAKKVVGLINEIAGKVWFDNLLYPFALIGYYAEPLFFKFYSRVPFITGSESAAKELHAVGIVKKKITIIHHGIQFVKVGSAIKKEAIPTLMFLGRISRDKGIIDCLNAFLSVKKTLLQAQLWIIGKEESSGLLKKILKHQYFEMIEKDIKYFGFVDEKKKSELLKKAWILVHPSKKEGWGLTVIEAAAQGTPAVGYNVEGLRDSIVHEQTGLLTKLTPEDLAESINKLLQDKKLYAKLAKEAQKRAETFTWKKSVEKSLGLLEKLYEKNRS